jgi:hypothetical protein
MMRQIFEELRGRGVGQLVEVRVGGQEFKVVQVAARTLAAEE